MTPDRGRRAVPRGSASCLEGPTSTAAPKPYKGDARIVYDLGRNVLETAFTDIYNLDTVQRHVVPELRWSGVSVASDGSFRQDVSSVNNIIGRFYGPRPCRGGRRVPSSHSDWIFRGETVTATVREKVGRPGFSRPPPCRPPNQKGDVQWLRVGRSRLIQRQWLSSL